MGKIKAVPPLYFSQTKVQRMPNPFQSIPPEKVCSHHDSESYMSPEVRMRWGYNSPTNDESRLLDELKSSFKATQLSKIISGCPASLSNYDRRTEYSASRERPVQTDQTLMSHRGPKLRNTSIEKYNSPEKNGG
jgi:hypothetical protein